MAKLQIDTNAKTVKVLDSMNLFELVKTLKRLLGEEYNNYTFEPGGYTYYWTNPVIIPYYTPTYHPYTPYVYPTITCGTGVVNIELTHSSDAQSVS
jgi:hypothetical protein